MATETYQLCIDALEGTSYRSTVLHFSGVGVATGDTLPAGDSLVAGFQAALQTLWLATLPPTYLLAQYRARRVSLQPSATAYHAFPVGTVAGTRGIAACAQQTCPVLFLVPTMGTKSGGKIFWPSVDQFDIANNTYTGAWKTAVINWLNAAQAGFTQAGITWTLAIYSRKHNTTSPVIRGTFSPVFGFQGRRRKPTGAV